MGFIKGGWKIEHDTYRIPRNYFKPTTKQPQNINKTSIPKSWIMPKRKHGVFSTSYRFFPFDALPFAGFEVPPAVPPQVGHASNCRPPES
jgi:hypothetical protein